MQSYNWANTQHIYECFTACCVSPFKINHTTFSTRQVAASDSQLVLAAASWTLHARSVLLFVVFVVFVVCCHIVLHLPIQFGSSLTTVRGLNIVI